MQSGKTVQYRFGNECCCFEPVTTASVLEVGDIVFCDFYGKRFCCHKIIEIEVSRARSKAKGAVQYVVYTIDTNECFGNVRLERHQIHGRMIEVVHASAAASA